MMNKRYCSFVFLLLAAGTLPAQEFCQDILDKAWRAYRGQGPEYSEPDYRDAQRILQDTEICDYENLLLKEKEGRRQLQDSIFFAINEQKEKAQRAEAEANRQRDIAKAATAEAQLQAAMARSAALAASARELLLKDPTLALNLAVAAYEVVPTAEAAQAMSSVLRDYNSVFYESRQVVNTQPFTDPVGENLEDLEREPFVLAPDGSTLLVFGKADTAWVLDVATGAPLFFLPGISPQDDEVRFTPDASALLVLDGSTLTAWDLRPENKSAPRGEWDAVVAFGYSPLGSKWCFLTSDDRLVIYDPAADTSRVVQKKWLEDVAAKTISITEDGGRLLLTHARRGAYGDSIDLWHLSAERPPTRFYLEGVMAASFAPDGESAIAYSRDTVKLLLTEARPGESDEPYLLEDLLPRLTPKEVDIAEKVEIDFEDEDEFRPMLLMAGFLPGGDKLFTLSRKLFFNPEVKVWEWDRDDWEAKLLFTLQGISGMTYSVASTLDAPRLLTVSAVPLLEEGAPYPHLNAELIAWDYQDKRLPVVQAAPPAGKEETPPALTAVSGSLRVEGDASGVLHIRSGRRGQAPLSIQAHAGRINSVAIAPGRGLIATASNDGKAKLWSLDGEEQQVWNEDENVFDVVSVFSFFEGLDLYRLADAGWDVDVKRVDFSPDGSRLLIAAHDKNADTAVLKVWEVLTKTVLFSLKGPAEAAATAAFSSDGTRIMATDSDGNTLIWTDPVGTLQAGGYYQVKEVEGSAYGRMPKNN